MPARTLVPHHPVPESPLPGPGRAPPRVAMPGRTGPGAPLLGILLLAGSCLSVGACLLVGSCLLAGSCGARAQDAVQGMALTRPPVPAASPQADAPPAPARPLPLRAEASVPAGRLPGQATGRMRERIVRDICIGCDAR
ncbi:hypothetical protein [Methylobacterium soli]|uniref:Uncharacterized protein n=1 Tax=Methylobacterium soli TaxID=553447 RepID=A0A6L3SZ33_9HYPH|nr:hypothetical protein [Methylobacterium soli]KAB1079371.1 hypothetical protein F6X53_11235 [Methylobacterium soli]